MSPQLHHPLILASASPRRHQLLAEAGYSFRVVSPPIDEPALSDSQQVVPPAWAESLAYFKARAVRAAESDGIILAADTIVAHQDRIIGKPIDEAAARRILSTMFAGPSDVITGVALLPPPPHQQRIVTHVTSTVIMRPMQPDEVDDYIASGAWRDKAGAYALQEGGDRFLQELRGSWSNVVGLPMERLAELLEPFITDPNTVETK